MAYDMNDEEQEIFFRDAGDNIKDATFLYRGLAEIDGGDAIKNATLTVSDGKRLYKFIDLSYNGTPIDYPGKNEAAINYNLARQLGGVEIGDEIKITTSEKKELTVTVSALFDNYVDSFVFISPDTCSEQLGKVPEYKSALANAPTGEDVSACAAAIANDVDGVRGVTLSIDTKDRMSSMMDGLLVVVAAIILCAGLLAFIVLYNLTNINISERIREIATIKVLGFYPKEAAHYVFRENLILTGAGAVFGLGLGSQYQTLFLNLLRHDDIGRLGGTLTVSTGKLCLLLRPVGFLQGLGLGHLLGSNGLTLGLGLLLATVGITVGNGNLGFILALHGLGIGLGRTDAGFADSLCLANLTHLLLFGHTHLGLIDGLGGSFLTECLDIAALVLDVRHIYVDESQTNLFEFHLYIGADGLQELVAVRVEFLNAHGGDYQTQLSEENVASQFLNLLSRLAKQTFCGSQHTLGVCADTHRKATRHVHTDVLPAEGIGEIGINADGSKSQIGIVLYDGPHEGTTTMHTLGTLVGTLATIDDQNLVGRTTTVTINQRDEKKHQYDDCNDDKIQ